MKRNFVPKTPEKALAVATLRLAQNLAKYSGRRRLKNRAVGTKSVLRPSEPLASTFTVQVISAETIAAGFPFGVRINVFAADPATAAAEASDQLRRLCQATREELVSAASRALTGA